MRKFDWRDWMTIVLLVVSFGIVLVGLIYEQ